MRSSNVQDIVEQAALLFASFSWTIVILAGIVISWIYQDVQTRWAYVLSAPPEALAQAVLPTATPTPTATLWTGSGPTSTPIAPQPPTPTATRVVQPPEILPETFVSGEPAPIVVADGDTLLEIPNTNPPAPAAIDQGSYDTAGTSEQPVVVAQTAGTPTRLVIEAVGIDSKIVPVGWSVVQRDGREYTIWNVADYAVGWHKTSALLG